jgi:hypothetical protein
LSRRVRAAVDQGGGQCPWLPGKITGSADHQPSTVTGSVSRVLSHGSHGTGFHRNQHEPDAVFRAFSAGTGFTVTRGRHLAGELGLVIAPTATS